MLKKSIAIFFAFFLAYGSMSLELIARATETTYYGAEGRYATEDVPEENLSDGIEEKLAGDETSEPTTETGEPVAETVHQSEAEEAKSPAFTGSPRILAPINSTTVVAYTLADLQSAITGNIYSLIYLGADITMPTGITWPVGRQDLIIDGTPPPDLVDGNGSPVNGAGERHTLTISGASAHINVANNINNNNHSITFRNMVINQSGNDRGIVSAFDTTTGANLANFKVVFEGIIGSGRSFVTAPFSQFEMRDSTINMVKTGSNVAPGKVASANRVILGGKVKVIKGLESDVITYTDGVISPGWTGPTSSAAALFDISKGDIVTATLRIEPDAKVLLDDRRSGSNDSSGIIQIFDSLTNNVDVIVGQSASFVALTRSSFDNQYNDGLHSFVVEKDGYALVVAETMNRASNSLIDIYATNSPLGEFRVEEGGSAYIISKRTSATEEGFTLFLSSGHLRLNNPRAVVIYTGPNSSPASQAFNVYGVGADRYMNVNNIRGISFYNSSSTDRLDDFNNVLDTNSNFIFNPVSSSATKLWALNGRDENGSGFDVSAIFTGTYLAGNNLNLSNRATNYPGINTTLSGTVYGAALPSIDNGTGANGMTFIGAKVVEIYGNYSKKPTVDMLPIGTTGTISGRGVPGAQIVVHIPDQPPGRITVAADGTWSLDISQPFESGLIDSLASGDQIIKVTQREMSVYGTLNDESEPVEAVVAYTVTEKYVDLNGNPISGYDDTKTYVRLPTPSYSKSIPDSIPDYIPVGYKISDSEMINDTTVEINPVTGNTTVYFIYRAADALLDVSVPVKLIFASFASGGGNVISPSYAITNRSVLPVKVSLAEFHSNGLEGLTLIQTTPANEGELNLSLVGSTNFSTISNLPDGALSGTDGYMGQLGITGNAAATGRFTIGGSYYGSFATPKNPQFSAVFTFELVLPTP